jgi:hypothetical protein
MVGSMAPIDDIFKGTLAVGFVMGVGAMIMTDLIAKAGAEPDQGAWVPSNAAPAQATEQSRSALRCRPREAWVR